ncbi:MAG: A24 family peptidase [Spirochaetaceae bacterium]|nr:A24 family peptidase [Spirochaetaceae bacterium]
MLISIAIGMIDIKTYRIPDVLLLVLFVILVFFDFLKGHNFVLLNLFSGAVIFTIFFVIYYFVGRMGFGDVKYVAVLSYGLGFKGVYVAVVIATVSCLLLFLIGYFFLDWTRKTKLPFAPFLSAGAISSIIIFGSI